MTMRKCAECGSEFKALRNALTCSVECSKIRALRKANLSARKRYEKNLDKMRAQRRQWAKKNPDKIRAYYRTRIDRNPEDFYAKRRANEAKHRERNREKRRHRAREDRVKLRAIHDLMIELHPELATL